MSYSGATDKRWFECLTQGVVLYSLVMLLVEVELTSGVDPVGEAFWQWNERLLVTLFGLEYLFRWFHAKNRLRYPISPLGLVDLMAVGPSMVGLALDLRSLKLLRALQTLWLFKLYRHQGAVRRLLAGFGRVKHELAVVGVVAVVVLLFSSATIYRFEHVAQPEKFARLSDAIWWSLVTMSTVGYGDLCPVTGPGRAVAVVTMLLGSGIFGTFVSLIGSSFLVMMRHDVHAPADDLDRADRSHAEPELEVVWSDAHDSVPPAPHTIRSSQEARQQDSRSAANRRRA